MAIVDEWVYSAINPLPAGVREMCGLTLPHQCEQGRMQGRVICDLRKEYTFGMYLD
jgi:hypothetical protein